MLDTLTDRHVLDDPAEEESGTFEGDLFEDAPTSFADQVERYLHSLPVCGNGMCAQCARYEDYREGSHCGRCPGCCK